jgi:hypothetical protein
MNGPTPEEVDAVLAEMDNSLRMEPGEGVLFGAGWHRISVEEQQRRDLAKCEAIRCVYPIPPAYREVYAEEQAHRQHGPLFVKGLLWALVIMLGIALGLLLALAPRLFAEGTGML